MKTQTPRIVKSPLSHRWFVVTRYTTKSGIDATTGKKHDYLVASVKYDVTDQMRAILFAEMSDETALTMEDK